LTSHGADVFGRILPVVLARTDRALLGFTLAEAQALQNQMRRMADNLKE
jgi:hypothetical protein